MVFLATPITTLDPSYFQALEQRVALYEQGEHLSLVSIPKVDLDILIVAAKKYSLLTQALSRGGLDAGSIEALCCVPFEPKQQYDVGAVGSSREYSLPYAVMTNVPQPQYVPSAHSTDDFFPSANDTSVGSTPFTAQTPFAAELELVAPRQAKRQQTVARTITFQNLPERVSYVELCSIVRGGQLLNIFIRSNEHWASVSFVRPTDAQGFVDHCNENGLTLRNEPIEVRWADRQAQVYGFVANKIHVGATRNLVIRRCGTKLSREEIAEDVDHIHNLILIAVDFKGGNCCLRTNSISSAITARTCMQSRLKYKPFKIEFDIDECSLPFETVSRSSNSGQTAHPQVDLAPSTAVWSQYQGPSSETACLQPVPTLSSPATSQDLNYSLGMDSLSMQPKPTLPTRPKATSVSRLPRAPEPKKTRLSNRFQLLDLSNDQDLPESDGGHSHSNCDIDDSDDGTEEKEDEILVVRRRTVRP